MSLQMVGGYVGATSIPPLIGLFSVQFGVNSMMYIVFVMAGILLIATEMTERFTSSVDSE